MAQTVFYFTQSELLKAARSAAHEKRSRRVDVRALTNLLLTQPPTTKYPVVFSFLHNDTEVRCNIAVSAVKSIWLDVDTDFFNKLSEVQVEPVEGESEPQATIQ